MSNLHFLIRKWIVLTVRLKACPCFADFWRICALRFYTCLVALLAFGVRGIHTSQRLYERDLSHMSISKTVCHMATPGIESGSLKQNWGPVNQEVVEVAQISG